MRSAAVLLLFACTAPTAFGQTADAPKAIQFCFWNVENLFDDKDDDRNNVDEEYDNPFSTNAKLRTLKFDRIASALVKLNDGKGPDVIACVEVESIRAADMLKTALNAKLKDSTLHYKHVLMKTLDAGRHIAPCVLTRLEVSNLNTRLHGGLLRILETHIYANGHELCIMATHWTSKTNGGDEGKGGREKYARTIGGVFDQFAKKNPATDFLVCGDFNDPPESDPVAKTLRTTGDKLKVVPKANDPFLLDLFAGKDPNKFGTHYYNRPLIYDHICVSPGLLDGDGWACETESVKTIIEGLVRPGSTRRQPWRFGSPKDNVRDDDRGYSDHFPVVVNLTVQAKKGTPTPKPKKGD